MNLPWRFSLKIIDRAQNELCQNWESTSLFQKSGWIKNKFWLDIDGETRNTNVFFQVYSKSHLLFINITL